jgi:hypothetical protein
MELADDALEALIDRMKQVQFNLRDIRIDLEKLRYKQPIESTVERTEEGEPPTEKQILFLKGLGVEEIPASKEDARRLLQELNEKREAGEYSPPPTEKQLKYLKDLKYAGEMPKTKDAAWKLLQDLKKD